MSNSKQNGLTIKYLRSILKYNKTTGEFTWRYRPDFGAGARWNKLYAGTRAGCVHSKGYVHIKIDRHAFKGHLLTWFYVTGKWPEEEIDHKNRKRADNRFVNLRPATKLEGAQNRPIRIDNTSGCPGVHWVEKNGKWRARIAINNKRVLIGDFAEKSKAIRAYKSKKAILHKFHPTIEECRT